MVHCKKKKKKKKKKETADLVTFTEEILNGKLHFLCSGLKFIRVQNLKETIKNKVCITTNVLVLDPIKSNILDSCNH